MLSTEEKKQKIVEWLKKFKSRQDIVRYNQGIYKGLMRCTSLLNLTHPIKKKCKYDYRKIKKKALTKAYLTRREKQICMRICKSDKKFDKFYKNSIYWIGSPNYIAKF